MNGTPQNATPEPTYPERFREVVSSNIAAIAFVHPDGTDMLLSPHGLKPDPNERGKVQVIFKNGLVWEYRPVPRAIAEEFLKAESVGKFFNEHIKGKKDEDGNSVYHAERIELEEFKAKTKEG